jgi:hypothetical protein
MRHEQDQIDDSRGCRTDGVPVCGARRMPVLAQRFRLTRVAIRYATKTAEGFAISRCVFTFIVGDRYIVFAFAEPGGVMVAGSCGPTVPIDSASKTMQILGPPLESRDDRKGLDLKSP